jgi:hypothetical protein
MNERLEYEGHQPMHDPNCEWSTKRIPCLRFSTDGTRAGALIAHTMGTTDEEEIKRIGMIGKPGYHCSRIDGPELSGMDEEQRDWECGMEDFDLEDFEEPGGCYCRTISMPPCSWCEERWRNHDESCESEFIAEAGQYSPCRCKERAEEARKMADERE